MQVQIIELTDEQKISILETTKELLGPNGEHWTKACWFGIKNDETTIREMLDTFGFEVPAIIEPDYLREADQDSEYEISRTALGVKDADRADVWCLMGALEEAAYRLGIVEERDSSERFAGPISLQALVETKAQWEGWSVIDVNDNPNTEWADIRDLLDERLAQLKETT